MEAVREVRPPLAIDTGASAQNATRLRREFTGWLAIDVTGEVLHDLALAVYEAIANIAEHAYADSPGGSGPVRLIAYRSRDAVLITIADDGRWRAATGEPYRSRGIPLIQELVQQMHIDRTPTGTVVYLRAVVPPPERAPCQLGARSDVL